MKVAVVMPRGSVLDAAHPNSMETVALALDAKSRFRSGTVFVRQGRGSTVLAGERTLIVPNLGSRSAHVRAVVGRLRAIGPDLVEHHQQFGLAAAIAARLPHSAHVLHRHTAMRAPRSLLDRWRQEARLERFDRILTVSDWARADFARHYPGLARRLRVVGNPIDGEAWSADPFAKEPLILFCGRATAEKGLDAFCAALEQVLDRCPSWRGALLLGDWARHEAWAAAHVDRLARFGRRVEVRHDAPRDVVRAVTSRAALAVVPSRAPETFGLAAVEAHAAGAAVVSSARGGLREASGSHALYIDPPEAPQIVAALNHLIENEARRLGLALAGQAFVAAAHSAEARAMALDDIRSDVVDSRRRAGALRSNALAPVGAPQPRRPNVNAGLSV